MHGGVGGVIDRPQGGQLFVGGSDHQAVVTTLPEVLQNADHGMGDTVDVGEELFGNHCDSHISHGGVVGSPVPHIRVADW